MPSRGTAPHARLASGARVSPLCRAPSHPPRSQRGAARGIRTGALPRRHVKTRRVASAQHRSHQGSGPSPEISHRNRVYLSQSQQDPECWKLCDRHTRPTISPGSIANVTVRTAWNLLPWRGLIFENAPTGRTTRPKSNHCRPLAEAPRCDRRLPLQAGVGYS